MQNITRRDAIKLIAGAGALSAFPRVVAGAGGRIVIVGGGAAGTIAAKHLLMADPGVSVTLIEKNNQYRTTLLSNTLLSGMDVVQSRTFGYDSLKRRGVKLIFDSAIRIDPDARSVVTSSGTVSYDRLIIAPGVSHIGSAIEGYDNATRDLMPDAWESLDGIKKLRKQLEQMRSGGTVVIAIPKGPFNSPIGPYERVGHIAHYLKQNNQSAKIIILDANDNFRGRELFLNVWQDLHPGMVEWIKGSDTGGGLKRIDTGAMKLFTQSDAIKADVANVIVPQKAADLASNAGVTDETGWVPVNPVSFESKRHSNIHVIGDSAALGGLPKSAQIAVSQALACAEAVIALRNELPLPTPRFVDVSYNVFAPGLAFSSVDVYRVSDDKSGVVRVGGGQCPVDAPASHREREFAYTLSWYNNITNEMFG